LAIIGNFVSDYDKVHFQIAATTPCERLQYLMQERDLTQLDLNHLVPQGNLSLILRGKRQIGINLACKLAEFFGVNKLVFLV
jgi:antitoxin component HigA of HigAB toxin-antitoxin module